MTTLSGRLPVSGHGTRVPVRVEDSDGRLAAAVCADQDGSWSVDVPTGTYTVRPKWLDPYEITVTPEPVAATAAAPADLDRLAARREGTWDADEPATDEAPAPAASWEPSERVKALRAARATENLQEA